MKDFHFSRVLIWCAVISLVLALGACKNEKVAPASSIDYKTNISEMHDRMVRWMDNNPCGYLRVRHPVFNVTGRFTAPVPPNTTVYLLTVHNTSIEGALFAAHHCAPISRAELLDSKRFVVCSLPAGRYALMVSRDDFVRSSGYPIVTEFSERNHTLRYVFLGGDMTVSLGVFEIIGQP